MELYIIFLIQKFRNCKTLNILGDPKKFIFFYIMLCLD